MTHAAQGGDRAGTHLPGLVREQLPGRRAHEVAAQRGESIEGRTAHGDLPVRAEGHEALGELRARGGHDGPDGTSRTCQLFAPRSSVTAVPSCGMEPAARTRSRPSWISSFLAPSRSSRRRPLGRLRAAAEDAHRRRDDRRVLVLQDRLEHVHQGFVSDSLQGEHGLDARGAVLVLAEVLLEVLEDLVVRGGQPQRGEQEQGEHGAEPPGPGAGRRGRGTQGACTPPR